MISILKTLLILCVFFLQLSSSSVIRRHGQHGLQHLTRSTAAPTTLSTVTLPSTLTDEDENLPDCDNEDENDEDSDDEDDSYQGDSDQNDSTQEHPEPDEGSNLDNDEDDSAGSDLPPIPTQGHSAAPQPTILSSITVALPTPSKGSSATPKPTTLSTLTVIPVPKTTSAVSQPPTSASGANSFWMPSAGISWQIELSGTVSDLTYAADVFDVDLFNTPTATIKTLKGNGKKVICYFSAGSFEDWRPDKDSFQASDKGSPLQGWPGEFWLRTDSANVRSIMANRIKMAQDKGCDGVDPDNVDGYDNENGLGLSQATAINYLTYMANEAHSRGLSIGLKNAGGIVADVLPIMEWHVNEQCLQYGECDKFAPFTAQNKPVFHIEYPDGAPNITPDVKTQNCNAASAKSFSTILKKMDLDAWADPCTL